MGNRLSKIDEEFIKNYGNGDNIGYVLKVDIEYPKELHDLHSSLPFLPERMKSNKCKKLACTLYGKKLCCSHKKLKASITAWSET